MAAPPKGKDTAADAIMPPAKMKPLLMASKEEPVQAAIGLTADGEALILLHKKMRPKKVLSTLRADAAKAKLALNATSLRFGRALVDAEYDPGMVRFFVNKEAPGTMRAKLVEVIKRVPFQKVEINVDPTLEDEPEDELPDAGLAAPPAPAGGIAVPPPPAPPPSLPHQPAPAPDAAKVRQALMALVARIAPAAGGDAGRRAALVALANQANDALKAGNAAGAAHLAAQLRDALESRGAHAGPVLRLWTDAKDAVDQQLGALYAVLRQTGLPVLAQVAEDIETVLAGYRTGLVAALADYDRAAAGDKAQARDGALRTVADYRARLAGDKHVTAADTNPFSVGVTARATLGSALDRVEAQLKAG